MSEQESKFPGIVPGSKEYIRLMSAWRRENPDYVQWQKDYHKKTTKRAYELVQNKKLAMTPNQLDEFRQKQNEASRKYKLKNPERKLYNSAKNRALKKSLDFDIEISDIHIPNVCPVLGIKLEPGSGILKDSSPSLDRIDNSKGYVKGNIHIISWRANSLKSNATIKELEAIARYFCGIDGGKNETFTTDSEETCCQGSFGNR